MSQPNPYRKPCPYPSLDVYRVLQIFSVTSPPIQHAIKKLLFAGKRPGGKSAFVDLLEARQSIERAIEMAEEEDALSIEEPSEQSAAESEHFCTYPYCKCPFDAPGDPNWCAHGYPHRKLVIKTE